MSTMELAAFLLQAIHASIPARCCSGVAFIMSSNEAIGALESTRNFYMVDPSFRGAVRLRCAEYGPGREGRKATLRRKAKNTAPTTHNAAPAWFGPNFAPR